MNSWLTARARRVVACTLLFWDHMPYTRRARIPSPNDQKRAINRRPVGSCSLSATTETIMPITFQTFGAIQYSHF